MVEPSLAVTLTFMTLSPSTRSTCWPSTEVSASASVMSEESRYSIVAPESFFVGVTVTSATVLTTDAA